MNIIIFAQTVHHSPREESLRQKLYGGIEAGGTKFVCAIATDEGEILHETQFPTLGPDETLEKVVSFFKSEEHEAPINSVGIGSFGPLDLRPNSPTYGHITTTPKITWRNIDIAGRVATALALPTALDTDVNAAALGENLWGAAQGLETFIYLTVGTGIGGGGMAKGQLLHGLIHPEMGHIPLPREREQDPFDGVCSYHADCFEGLASGPAIEARWGQSAEDLPADHPAWQLEAKYLGQALAIYVYVLSPERIILGGGVMKRAELFPLVRRELLNNLAGYVGAPEILDGIDGFVQPPKLGDRAGVLGAAALAIALFD
jgi:fructokinase